MNTKIILLEITSDQISSLSLADDLEISDRINKEELQDLKKKSSENLVSKGKLYFKCFSILKNEVKLFKDKSLTDISKKIEELKLDEDFEKNIQYLSTGQFGQYYTGRRIESFVRDNREQIDNLINFFFKIFIEVTQ